MGMNYFWSQKRQRPSTAYPYRISYLMTSGNMCQNSMGLKTGIGYSISRNLPWIKKVCQAHDKKIIFYLPTPVIPLYFQENGIPPEKGYPPAFSDISRILHAPFQEPVYV